MLIARPLPRGTREANGDRPEGPVGGKGFESSIYGDPVRVGGADDGGEHRPRHAERHAAQLALRPVHQRIGARL